jgi:hypothetical protein
LIGGRCVCGYVFFPAQTLGCESCGRYGSELSSFELSGQGQVVSKAIVFVHADPKRPPPFAVAEIKLAEGPVVRALLAGPADNTPETGESVVASMFPPNPSDPEGRLDVGFVRTGGI